MNNQNGHLPKNSASRLRIALAIVLVMLVVEVVGGLVSGSLALLGDAGHMLVDALALVMTLFAFRIARRPASTTKTFGYHRVEIMAALANGVVLVVTAVAIVYQAYQRFQNPPEVKTTLMLVVAVVGLIANLVGILLLRSMSEKNLNIRGAFWHIVGDTISSVGVIVAGIIIAFTGQQIFDPIIAILIAVIILVGAVNLLRESSDILLEAVPKHIQMDKVIESIQGIRGVREVHDLHVWTISSGVYALSAHLLIEDQMVSRGDEIIKTVTQSLANNFNIGHTTLQTECQACEKECVCNVREDMEDTPVG